MFSDFGTAPKSEELSLSQFQQKYNAGELKTVTKDDLLLTSETKDGKKFRTNIPAGNTLKDIGLEDSSKTDLVIKNNSFENGIRSFLLQLIPFALFVVIIFFLLKQAQGSANSAFSFGQSRARLHDKEKNKTKFADVAGAEEAKEDLKDIVDFLKNPKKYTKMGAKIPKGVLLYGSPGTGKTLLARAVAGEADVPFFSISGSEFVEMFVGVGASRVRDLFKKAKRSAPAIIFIDEIDAVGRQRGAGMGGGHDEREQTLNQILTEMDGFEVDTNVIIIAATNRPDVLDPALLRPGRFDRRITIDKPNVVEREQILKVHADDKPLAKEVDFQVIAKKTPGFTGADLENLLNEAAILAAKENKKEISMADIMSSFEKVALGPEKKSRKISEDDKKVTAYHELGHAIIGSVLPYCDPIHKISIISRGMALGVTWSLPEDDFSHQRKIQFEQELSMMLGGRAAEEHFFGKEQISTGASSDMEKASELARKMVTEFGMSPLIGPMVLESRKNIFLGRDLGESRQYSDDTARIVDEEVKRIIQDAYHASLKLVSEHEELFHEVAEELLKKEELNDEEFQKFFEKHGIGIGKTKGEIVFAKGKERKKA